MANKIIATEDYFANELFSGYWEWSSSVPNPWDCVAAMDGSAAAIREPDMDVPARIRRPEVATLSVAQTCGCSTIVSPR